MAAMAPAKPKHMYRWWWDSHISPKNSKWLQENLTDMDAKVTQMIKLIEEDADSFARRAEMYYKKRPELMKMVEEFYRAYRALAERYDHATVALRQAHRTMTEAFPNQVPSIMGDESLAASATEGDPRTPAVSPFRFLHDPDESHKDAAGPGGRARKGLSFQDVENHEWGGKGNGNHDPKGYVESERFSKAELEISTLKNALSKLEAEKEASHLQYQQTLDKLSSLESEVSRMTEDSRGVREQARKADEEAQNLKDVLAKLETEREVVMVQLQQYEDRISNLEKTISQAQKDTAEAEADANTIKQETDRLEAEKESALLQHKKLLEKISEREDELLHAEEDARKAIERAGKAESEAENLRQMLAKLTEEKEVAAVQYLQCLETIAALERKLAVAEEEKQKLKLEMDDTVSKFKDAEERCLLLERSNQSMHSEMESKSHEMAVQREELAVKQQELGILWSSLREERLRFVEAETAFQTLQHLHSQSQDELRSLAAEFQKQNQMLGDLESYNQRLQNEVEHIKGENKGLNEVNLSSAMTIQELQAKLLKLRDTIGELEAEVELRVDQRNALQQEIYCLKEELNELKKNHQLFIEQVESVGFSPVSFVEDVKGLLDVNMKLKEDCERGTGEKVALMEKLVVMNELVEKNALLENSLSDLNVELDGVRDKVNVLEESCQSLQGEKSSLSNETSTLVSQLHAANDNLERTVEKNSSLENSLLNIRHELEALQVKLKSLQDSCSVLENEKSILAKEAEDLKASLAAEKHGHATMAKISETQLAGMELEISEIREKLQQTSIEFDAELEEATNAQIEIFVMEESIHDFMKKNFALLVEFEKLLEATQLSKKLVSELQNEKVDRDMQTRSLFEQLNMLREGLYQVLNALDADQSIDDIEEEDKALLSLIVNKLKATQFILCDMQDDKQKLVIENTLLLTLVRELQLEVENIVTAKIAVDQQYSAKCEQFLLLQAAAQKLAETNGEMEIELTDKEQEEAAMKDELRSMKEQLLDLEGAHLNLRDEKIKVLDEQSYLMKLVSDLKLEKHNLEEEYLSILSETICQGTLSTIFQDFVSESSMALKELSHDRDEVLVENGALKESAKVMEGKEAVLIKTIEEFRCKLEGLDVIRADQATQIMKLSGECDQHKQQADSAHEANQSLEFELKRTADMLNNEVQSKAKEIDIMETEAEALLGKLQTSLFQAALLEGKIYDLADSCSHLEDKNHFSEIEIDQLKERVDIADAGNREIRSGVSMYAAAFVALKDSIGELENHTAPKRALSEVHGNETKESLVYDVGSHQQTSEEKISKLPYAASDLWELRTRIKAIENSVVGKERLLRLETEAYGPTNAYPNGKELGSGRPKYTHEISEEDNEVITKDIMLDQVSERINFDAGNARKLPAVRSKKEHSRERLSRDSLGEKQLSIDRLDISKNFSGSRQDGDERKLLERLNSDSEKLISLDIVIQDLKKKVEVAEKSTKGKGMEYDRVKEQLEESEQAIKRLSEMNQNLGKTVEEDSSDEAGLMKRRRVSEQARRGSEKVGRLQLEVQKLQYRLAKLDDETKSKGKAKAAKKKKRVLLRDYLYGGTRTGPRRKKGHFCSCVRPATIGD